MAVTVFGKPATFVSISFPDTLTGNFVIRSKPEITAAIVFPTMGKTCSCQDDPKEKQRRDEAGEAGPTCLGGTIIINTYNRKTRTVEGSINAHLEGTDAAKIIYGKLQGKFSARLANQDLLYSSMINIPIPLNRKNKELFLLLPAI